MYSSILKGLVTCVIPFALGGVGNAAIIYSALPNQSGGTDLNCCREADNFTVATATTAQFIKFWTFQGSAASYAGSIAWSINTDSAGKPGTSVASGSATPTPVATGITGFGLNEFSYLFAVNVPLTPGNYWVVLHNGPTSSIPSTDFFWEFSNGNAGNSQSQDLALPNQPWISNFAELAFEVQDNTPEPASILLLGAGLAAVLYRKRLQ